MTESSIMEGNQFIARKEGIDLKKGVKKGVKKGLKEGNLATAKKMKEDVCLLKILLNTRDFPSKKY